MGADVRLGRGAGRNFRVLVFTAPLFIPGYNHSRQDLARPSTIGELDRWSVRDYVLQRLSNDLEGAIQSDLSQ